jgi:hypothetical protein
MGWADIGGQLLGDFPPRWSQLVLGSTYKGKNRVGENCADGMFPSHHRVAQRNRSR